MRQVVRASFKRKHANSLVLAAAAASVGIVSLQAPAATLDWDADPVTSGVQAGNGTWFASNPSANTWLEGSTQTAWTSGNVARFDTAGRSHVTLSGDISATDLHNLNGGVLMLGDGSSLSTTATFRIGEGAGTAAAFYQTGGSVSIGNGNNNFRLGANNGYGFYSISGGTLGIGTGTVLIGRTPSSSTGATGVFYQSGGTITSSAKLELSASQTGSHSVYYMTGGTFTTSEGFLVGMRSTDSTSQLTITNAAMVSTSFSGGTGRLQIGHTQVAGTDAGQVAVVNLNAGALLQVARIVSEGVAPDPTAVRLLNFNGGTVRFAGTSNDSLPGELLAGGQQFTAINVYAGGATFEVVNEGIFATIGTPLVAPAGDGIAGTVIPVVDGGSGYIGAPVVKINGVTGATAVANMVEDGNGTFKVASITITSPGINATDTPTFEFIGGGAVVPATGGTLATAPNVSGGLTKKGVGILRISAPQGYTGETRVEEGVLRLINSGNLHPSTTLTVLSGAEFEGNNTAGLVVSGLKGGGTIRARNGAMGERLLVTDLLAPGDSIGTLTFSEGDLRVGDGAIYEYEIGGTSDAPLSDLIALTQGSNSGDLSFDGAWTLKVLNVGSVEPTPDMEFVLFTYTSNAHPDLGLVTIDLSATSWAGGVVTVDTAGKRVILSGLGVIPEPSALALIGLMALPMMRRRRRS